MNQTDDAETVLNLSAQIGEYDPAEVAEQMKDIAPENGAAALEFLPPRVAANAAARMDTNLAAKIIGRMDTAMGAKLFELMPVDSAAKILCAMEPDDRVDALEKLDHRLHEALIDRMGAAQAEETRKLELYPPDTAGGIMTTNVTALPRHLSVEQAIAELRRLHEKSAQLFYVYVVDQNRRLMGVLSMRDLVLARPDEQVDRIMFKDVRSIPATLDQEEVARRMKSSRFLAMPVVDEAERLVGLVTYDDVVDVIQEEASEDLQRMFGAGAEERLNSPWRFSFSKRIGWLAVNLLTAFFAGWVVGLFGSTISRFAVLAIYMPVVSGMGTNAGAQAMSVAIRGITSGVTDKKMLRSVLFREMIVGALGGLVIGSATACIAALFQYQHGYALGLVVAVSLMITQTIACVSGSGLPFLMRKLGFDPAQSATIFATTVSDVTGFATLLGFARICEHWLH